MRRFKNARIAVFTPDTIVETTDRRKI